MSFKDLQLKVVYNSEFDDVASQFYIPVLKEAKNYKRAAAYYSSNSIKLIAEGLSGMFSNDGKVQLLVSVLVSEKDFDAVSKAIKTPDDILKEMPFYNGTELKELMQDDNVAAFAYLVATNRMEIKFVICKNPEGIFHLKFGILTDLQNNLLCFSGSMNETYGGMKKNVDAFDVFRSWVTGGQEYINEYSNSFENYWNGKISKPDFVIIDLPDKAKNLIEEVYTKTINQPKKERSLHEPRNYQEEAINKWKANGYKGILEMATGTGKTLVALHCIDCLNKLFINQKFLVIIGCPTKILVDQWEKHLRKSFKDFDIITVSSDEKDYKSHIYNRILSDDSKKHTIVIGAYKSLSNTWFRTDTVGNNYRGNIFFIADEVHCIGSEKLSDIQSEIYNYRLGLTATPVRYFDIEGTQKIVDYFKGIVYTYRIKQAIDEGHLVKYDYYIYFESLTSIEMKKYAELTKKHARSYYVNTNKEPDEKTTDFIAYMRATIIKKAENKKRAFQKIIDYLKKNKKLSFLLIYLEDEDQVSNYVDILNNFDVRFRIIDQSTTQDDRNRNLKDLSKNSIDCILAKRILDEGVDVPEATRAIFVSSSSNPRQYIQRRGRVLRIVEGEAMKKEKAEIYDICVLADENAPEYHALQNIESKIAASEFKRLAVFSVTANNHIDCYNLLKKEGNNRDINVFEIINNAKRYEDGKDK